MLASIVPEDVKRFGRLVGLGTLICGVGVLFFGGMFFAFEKTASELLALIGTVGMIVLLGVGIGISLYAIKKYNKRIF